MLNMDNIFEKEKQILYFVPKSQRNDTLCNVWTSSTCLSEYTTCVCAHFSSSCRGPAESRLARVRMQCRRVLFSPSVLALFVAALLTKQRLIYAVRWTERVAYAFQDKGVCVNACRLEMLFATRNIDNAAHGHLCTLVSFAFIVRIGRRRE